MANIEIDPITGAPIIKPKEQPTAINPIMPVTAEPTSSPGLTTPVVSIPPPVTIPSKPTTPVQPSPALAKVLEDARVTADATVGEGEDKHISITYPAIQQALREGGGDTQQQAQTFAKIKELLDSWAE